VVASAGLGALGDTEGPPVYYDWVPASPLPPLIPWLTLLVLLALPSNRTLKAWWIWAPILLLAASEPVFRPLLDFIPSGAFAMFHLAFNSLAFGIAAIWLLAEPPSHRLRFVMFLKMTCIAAAMSSLAYLVRADWESPGEAFGFMVFLGVSLIVTVTALSLAGLICRRRYRPIVLVSAFALLCTALWLLITLPFFLLAMVASGGGDWAEFVQALLTFASLNIAVLLPFLVLAMANTLYRRRLVTLLHLCELAGALPPPPPAFTNAPEPATATVPDI
jgi:hypothetical protein